MDGKLTLGDQYRVATRKLNTKLQEIQQFYASLQAPAHSGQPDCERCSSKNDAIQKAWREYFVFPDGTAWLHGSPQLPHQVNHAFTTPPGNDAEAIINIIKAQTREHFKEDLCSAQLGDSQEAYSVKEDVSDMFLHGQPTRNILNFYRSALPRIAATPEAAEFIQSLETARTPEQRAEIYTNYYCASEWNDTPQQKNFKAKYARMFQEPLPHDEVVESMKREAEASQRLAIEKLQSQLSDLQMAQSAHVKSKAKEAEKEDRMLQDPSPRIERCALEMCIREVDLNDENGVVECAICEWLDRQGRRDHERQGRFYYCSIEHAEDDFVSSDTFQGSGVADTKRDDHDRHEHRCCMGRRCFYFPQFGPPGETGGGGICQDCADYEEVSYFCSQNCYQLTLVSLPFYVNRGRGS
jgi:hypothetical protein